MTVELYKDEKLMPWWAAERQARIGFCPNPQSLRALMTARHDPPGKILAIMEHATSNMQLKVSRIYGYVVRPKEREKEWRYVDPGKCLFMGHGLSREILCDRKSVSLSLFFYKKKNK